MRKIVRTTAATLAITAAFACGTASAQTGNPDAGSSTAFHSLMCAVLGISSEHNIFCTGLIIG
ncbi:hypothetical protein ACTWPB_13545 [Nocardia sp. IBHARD005]|uniref:hypothetical protein n=1 Tax=Nocardia sp. IBHARD005 TaxID=3457765 RepID=UPI00405952DA